MQGTHRCSLVMLARWNDLRTTVQLTLRRLSNSSIVIVAASAWKMGLSHRIGRPLWVKSRHRGLHKLYSFCPRKRILCVRGLLSADSGHHQNPVDTKPLTVSQAISDRMTFRENVMVETTTSVRFPNGSNCTQNRHDIRLERRIFDWSCNDPCSSRRMPRRAVAVTTDTALSHNPLVWLAWIQTHAMC